MICEELNGELRNLAQVADNFRGSLDCVSGQAPTPQTLGIIPAQIFGKWNAEAQDKLREMTAISGQSFWKRFRFCFREVFWDDQSKKSCGYWPAMIVLFFAALIIGLILTWVVSLFSGTKDGWVLLGFTLTLYFGILIGFPLNELRLFEETRERERELAEERLNQRISEFWNNPPILLEEVQLHLEQSMKDYLERLTDLEKRFKIAIVEPRIELDKRLLEFHADKLALKELGFNELPERETLLNCVENQISECEQLRGELSPQEKDINEKLRLLNLHLEALQRGVNDLVTLRVKYQSKEALLKRVESYATLGEERWLTILASKRDRELSEIETALSSLDEEVTWTRGALSEITTLLPATNAYQLPTSKIPKGELTATTT